MRYVYLLKSEPHPTQRYVGLTANLRARLADHTAGRSPHTAKYRPWRLVAYLAFTNERQAAAFEQYLKSGSGRSFATKHLWPL